VRWGALGESFPKADLQRCWFHKIDNVLEALPKSARPGAKQHLAEIWNAEDETYARQAVKGPGSRADGLATAFKLIESAQTRWRAVNAPTSSPSSAQEQPSLTASWSNAPTTDQKAPKNLIH
jgi:transposase-like protein